MFRLICLPQKFLRAKVRLHSKQQGKAVAVPNRYVVNHRAGIAEALQKVKCLEPCYLHRALKRLAKGSGIVVGGCTV